MSQNAKYSLITVSVLSISSQGLVKFAFWRKKAVAMQTVTREKYEELLFLSTVAARILLFPLHFSLCDVLWRLFFTDWANIID